MEEKYKIDAKYLKSSMRILKDAFDSEEYQAQVFKLIKNYLRNINIPIGMIFLKDTYQISIIAIRDSIPTTVCENILYEYITNKCEIHHLNYMIVNITIDTFMYDVNQIIYAIEKCCKFLNEDNIKQSMGGDTCGYFC